MCEVKAETTVERELLLAMSALMMPDEPIPGGEDGEFLPDKYVWAKHAYEHLKAADSKLHKQLYRSCACTAAAVIGDMCMECFLNSAIEGEDYVLHNNKLFLLHK